jgi:hypothetical protein
MPADVDPADRDRLSVFRLDRSYINASKVKIAFAEGWNGTSWKAQLSPDLVGGSAVALSSVSCRASSACEAVGSYINSKKVEVPLAEVWNGRKWKVQAVGNPGDATGAFTVRSVVRGGRHLRSSRFVRERLQGAVVVRRGVERLGLEASEGARRDRRQGELDVGSLVRVAQGMRGGGFDRKRIRGPRAGGGSLERDCVAIADRPRARPSRGEQLGGRLLPGHHRVPGGGWFENERRRRVARNHVERHGLGAPTGAFSQRRQVCRPQGRLVYSRPELRRRRLQHEFVRQVRWHWEKSRTEPLRTRLFLLSDDVARSLVAAETLELRVAQLPVGRPLREADVGDELRLDPMNAFHARAVRERRLGS